MSFEPAHAAAFGRTGSLLLIVSRARFLVFNLTNLRNVSVRFRLPLLIRLSERIFRNYFPAFVFNPLSVLADFIRVDLDVIFLLLVPNADEFLLFAHGRAVFGDNVHGHFVQIVHRATFFRAQSKLFVIDFARNDVHEELVIAKFTS